ncbi:MAG: hypothetical protein IT266_01165 [Saprospiraceae bacterium]|nr:hypothetical protein [Saprospiraceae bacterium]
MQSRPKALHPSQSSHFRQRLLLILFACFLAIGIWFLQHRSASKAHPGAADRSEVPSGIPGSGKRLADDHVASYVLEVLNAIDQTEQAPTGYVGGRTFFNREQRLPLAGPDGKTIEYREWDVKPRVPGKPRGAERLVTGSDRSAWYTKDHYQSFHRLR